MGRCQGCAGIGGEGGGLLGAGHDALKVSSLRDVRSKPFLGILNSFMDGRISRAIIA